VTTNEIDALHRTIARVIRDITTVNCKVVALPAGVASGRSATTYALAAATNTLPLEFVERERGGRAPVVALYPPRAYETRFIGASPIVVANSCSGRSGTRSKCSRTRRDNRIGRLTRSSSERLTRQLSYSSQQPRRPL
jgi:hypothetical protein